MFQPLLQPTWSLVVSCVVGDEPLAARCRLLAIPENRSRDVIHTTSTTELPARQSDEARQKHPHTSSVNDLHATHDPSLTVDTRPPPAARNTRSPPFAMAPASGYKHGDNTPKRAMVRGTISYLESQGLPVNKSAIFRHFDLSRSQGYAALSSPSSSKRSDPEWEETRGRPSKVSEADQRRMEALLWEDEGPQQHPQHQQHELGQHHHGEGGSKAESGTSADSSEAGGFNWTRLAKAAGVEVTVNPRTLHRAMGTLGYRRCLSCGQNVVHRRCREKRADWARRMLETYPSTEDWRRVRFSIELHFGFGLDGRVRLLPRPGERLQCPSCNTGDDASGSRPDAGWSRDIRKVHAWAAAGYGFKSGLVFYEDSTSPNCGGTPSMADYQYKILDKEVRSWLSADPTFVLYEDVEAFAHGGLSKQNAVQAWKESVGLRHVFSCGDAPDLNPLETLWPPAKQWQFGEGKGESGAAGGGEEDGSKNRDWEDETLRGMARRAWEGMEQERVNIWVDFMVQRLRQVVESEGRLVPW